jgi:hypothetical protein
MWETLTEEEARNLEEFLKRLPEEESLNRI